MAVLVALLAGCVFSPAALTVHEPFGALSPDVADALGAWRVEVEPPELAATYGEEVGFTLTFHGPPGAAVHLVPGPWVRGSADRIPVADGTSVRLTAVAGVSQRPVSFLDTGDGAGWRSIPGPTLRPTGHRVDADHALEAADAPGFASGMRDGRAFTRLAFSDACPDQLSLIGRPAWLPERGTLVTLAARATSDAAPACASPRTLSILTSAAVPAGERVRAVVHVGVYGPTLRGGWDVHEATLYT
jgi:hypothetical protein